ncbi:MAG: hypothetical protein ACYC2O_12230, partial [Microthrixaceae bacterium]
MRRFLTIPKCLGVVLMAVLCVEAVVPSAAGAEVSGPSADHPLGTADRVLVFSVPTLTWDDMETAKAPNLDRLLRDAAIADLSVRSVSRQTTATDGYATLNAGTRARGTPLAALAFVAGLLRSGSADSDGDPLEPPADAFQTDPPTEDADAGTITAPDPEPIDPALIPPEAGESYDGTPAAEEFARRTGVEPAVGEVFNFGLVSMLQTNDRLLFGAEVGALGTALSDAGVGRAIIANGDHGEGSDDVDFRREASVGLMDGDGLVERGRVGRTLLESDPSAPFGTRLDTAEVEAAFEEFWDPNSVVLVEASDMVRMEDASGLTTEAQRIRLRRQAIERSDALLGRLLAHVDLSTDAVIVVAPYASGASNALTVVGVRAPQVAAGLLSSGTTRRAGFVQTVDLAPTITSLLDVPVPSSMEGTQMERKGEGGDYAARRQMLTSSSDAAEFRDATVGFASTLFVLAQLVLWALAIISLTVTRRGLRATVEIATLAVLIYLPVTFLAGALPFHEWGSAAYWAFVIVVSAAIATVTYLLTRRALVDP